MPTVQKLARELGLTSQEVMARLKALGRPAEGHLSHVEDQVAERLRRETTGSSAAGQTSDDDRSAAAAGTDGAPVHETPAEKTSTAPSTGAQSAAKKTTAKKTTGKKTTAKKTTGKKTTAKKTTARKTPAKKTTARKTTATKTTASGGEGGPVDGDKDDRSAEAGSSEGEAPASESHAEGPSAAIQEESPPEAERASAGPQEEGKPKGLLGRFRKGKAEKVEPATRPGDKRKPAPPKTKAARSKWLKRAAELPLLVLVAFLVAVVIKMFLVQAFFIPSGSMRPTLRDGDRVLVEKLSYLFGSPNQGDVIVFARPDATEKPKNQEWYDDAGNFMRDLLGLPTPGTTDYIKRVAAVGGDTIRYEGSPRVLTVNGKTIKEPYLQRADEGSLAITSDTCGEMKLEPEGDGCRVPAGTVFVLGDNRTSSQDSRFLGPIKQERIIGRAFVVIWPFKDFSGL